jgi:hypothetical protein
MDSVNAWVEGLKEFRTRARARGELARYGPAAAEQILPLILDSAQPENTRWAAIMVVKTWRHAPAVPLLMEVLRTHAGLRGAAIQALEAITGLSIGDVPDEWDRALADPEAYRREHQEPEALSTPEAGGEPDGCRLFRHALGSSASETTWEPEGFLYLRIPLAGGRKQQVLVTFSELDASGRPLATIYTECGPLQPEAVESIGRRNVTARYGKFQVEKDEQGVDKVVMRETVPLQRLTPKLARDIVLSMAAEADSLEQEMSGSDHI